jgi:hypothetical protein
MVTPELNSSMSSKDLIDTAFQLVGFINSFWAAYATITVARLGWLFASKDPGLGNKDSSSQLPLH